MSAMLLPNQSPYEKVRPPSIYVEQAVTWEYKQVVCNLRQESVPSEAELNELGKEGWGLAGVITDSPFIYLYFLRAAR